MGSFLRHVHNKKDMCTYSKNTNTCSIWMLFHTLSFHFTSLVDFNAMVQFANFYSRKGHCRDHFKALTQRQIFTDQQQGEMFNSDSRDWKSSSDGDLFQSTLKNPAGGSSHYFDFHEQASARQYYAIQMRCTHILGD